MSGERRFEIGDRVTVKDATTLFHTRTQRFIRGRTGTVEIGRAHV